MFKSIAQKFHQWRGEEVNNKNSFMMMLLVIMVAIGPFFFIPIMGMSVIASKGYFFISFGLIVLLGSAISALKHGEIGISKNWLFRILGFILVSEFIGALLSPAFGVSLLGRGYEATTWIFLLIFTVITLGAYRTVRSYERLGIILIGAISGIMITVVFQVVRFFIGGSALSLGVLTSGTASLFGSWVDFGTALAFVVMFSVITLELGGLKKNIRIIVFAMGLLAVVILAFMNIRTIWIILGFVSLITTLYIFTFAFWDSEMKTYRKNRNIPWYSLMIIILSIVCIFFGNTFNSFASRHQIITPNDIRLSALTTARVGFRSVMHNPLTGYGANTFSTAWNMSKPPAVSGTNFATISFAYGSGYIPTQMATNGILGVIGWIAFLLMIAWLIISSLMKGFESSLDRYVITLLSGSILLLVIVMFFTIVSSYVLILLAILLGSLVGISAEKNQETELVTSFIKDPRASFFGIFGITILIIVTVFASYVEIRKLTGAVYAVKGANAENSGNLDNAINYFSLASVFALDDSYERELSALTIGKVNQLTGTVTQANRDTVSKQAESILGTALGHAQSAQAINPADYQNWIAVGNVYRTLVTLGVTDAAASAKSAYTEAQKRNPHDAGMFLLFAQLNLAQSDNEGALSEIAQSINYFPTSSAYLLRAQIQASKQNYTDAIVSMTEALKLDPYNATTAYQLGLLFYQQGDYAHAITAFKTAIYDNRSFGLAYGYLGVSYEKSGDLTNANTVYDYIRKQSDQADVLINQIKNGATPTASTTAIPSTSSGQATPPSTLKLPSKQVAPTTKKK
jgi:tetratricopeptide (TPR) repeat protein